MTLMLESGGGDLRHKTGYGYENLSRINVGRMMCGVRAHTEQWPTIGVLEPKSEKDINGEE